METTLTRRPISLTRLLPNPNQYIVALDNEYAHRAFNEERAPLLKGQWRSVFEMNDSTPLDLEIGTGNGFHFAYHANRFPERCFLGIELKYKPLIQSIRRAMLGGAKNAAMIRYHAFNLFELFEENELNNIYIHFPDPWVTPRKPRNRVVNRDILGLLHRLQRPGSFIEFKTDSREYFLWALEEIKNGPYQIEFQTLDLHSSEIKEQNFSTAFEKIFVRQNVQINYAKLIR